MFKLDFTNSRGKSIELYSAPFRLMKFDGLGDVSADNQTQKSPYQDGATLIGTILEERQFSIELKITGKDELELGANRRKLISIFNPKLGVGVFKRVSIDGIHQINAVSESVPFFPDGAGNRGASYQKALINLKAPNPYWQSLEETTEPLAAFVPKFKFPFTFPVKFGERGSQATLINDGDVPCPIKIEFNGPATNPEIRNLTTGEFIRVRREIKDGEKLIINTSEGRDRKVVIDHGNGIIENAWGYIDIWESTLLQLDVGENIITYDALNSGGQAVVNISFRKLYVGV